MWSWEFSLMRFSLIRLKYRFSPLSDPVIDWCCPTPPPLPPGDTCYTLVWGFQDLRRKQSVIFPHWWSPNGSPNPPSLVKLGFLSARDVVRQWFQEEERRRPILPNHTVQRSSAALFPIQDPTPPTPDRGIFSEAENPSHELSSSTEVIKHGWFVVIDVVLLPWTDPQTLESTPMIKKKKFGNFGFFAFMRATKCQQYS